MDFGSIAAATTSLKTAADIAKTLGELKSISEVQSKVIDLQTQILSAQSNALAAQAEQSTLIQRISELEEEIALIKAWEKQKERYQLISPWQGNVVYALKESRKENEPPHFICTKCYEEGRKSILNQQIISSKATRYMLHCPACNAEVHSPWNSALEIEYASS